MVLRTAIHVSTGLFWGKNCFNYLFFFGLWAGNLSKFDRLFSSDQSKFLSMPAEEILGKRQNLRKIWSVLAQILGMNVNLDSTCPEDRKHQYLQIFLFYGHTTFQIFGEFFLAELPNMQSMWAEMFSNEKI